MCGNVPAALDLRSPVFGLPTLPETAVIGDPVGGFYHPSATTNVTPGQEPGTKRARALPYRPNANLIVDPSHTIWNKAPCDAASAMDEKPLVVVIRTRPGNPTTQLTPGYGTPDACHSPA